VSIHGYLCSKVLYVLSFIEHKTYIVSIWVSMLKSSLDSELYIVKEYTKYTEFYIVKLGH
jgi:hypothetical protein